MGSTKTHSVWPVLGLAVLCGCGAWSGDRTFERRYPAHDGVARLLATDRPFVARLSGSQAWSECAEFHEAGQATAVSCANYRSSAARLAEAATIAGTAHSKASREGDQGWAIAAADLAALGSRSDRVDRIVDRLREVVGTDETNAALRSDLAVAHLARFGLRSDATALFEGLDQIERAAALDPTSPVVVFNQALMLERLHLDVEAAAAWSRYRSLDATSRWADEAALHVRVLAARRASGSAIDAATGWHADVRADPQGARENVLAVLLPTWAEHARNGNRIAADSDAIVIAHIGDVLLTLAGDSSVAQIARLTRMPTRGMLRGVAAFDSGARAFRRGEYTRAQETLQVASRVLVASGAASLVGWADVMVGFASMYAGNYAGADARLARVEHEATHRGEIALRARALWGRGLSSARQGKTATAVDEFTAASALFRRLGERTNEGTMLAQVADVLFLLGRDDAAMNAKLKSLEAMSVRGDARARTGAFIALGKELAETGLPAAGVAVLREAVALAPASTRVNDLPEALIRLSDAEIASGRIDGGRTRLANARAALRAVKDSAMHQRLGMEVNAAEATLASADAPALAVARLGMVEQYYRRGNLVFDLGAPLVHKARLELRLADTAGATRDLRAAAAAIAAHTVSATDLNATRDRATARRDVYRELVALALARSDTLAAFLAAEQGRGNQIATAPEVGDGQVILSYLTLPSETVMWVTTRTRVRLVRIPVTTARLAALIDSLENAMRSTAQANRVDSLSRRLHALLVAPAAPELAQAHGLMVVPDGKLGRIPFGALRDAHGHPLIERVAITYAAAVRAASPYQAVVQQTLVIGNPAFDAGIFPELQPLQSAATEAAGVASHYAKAMLLSDALATKSAVIAALPHASLVHFAGHAQLVERAPTLSHLVLARSGESLQSNTLSAAEIAAMNLRGVRLAILSTCGTTQSRSRRDDGESGLAEAFLAAGAKGVVSSLWAVDDKAASDLMNRFHRHLAAGKEPGQALRFAQLEEAAVRPIETWSAFRYEVH
ncbi:MAG: CHAT domain-containing protein [bacterium]